MPSLNSPSKLQHTQSTPDLQAETRHPAISRSGMLGAWVGALRRTLSRGGGAKDARERKGKARERAVQDIPNRVRQNRKHTDAREHALRLANVKDKENRAPEEGGMSGDGKGGECVESPEDPACDQQGVAGRVEVPAGRRAPLGDVTDLYTANAQSSWTTASSTAGAASRVEGDTIEESENEENEENEG
ncbi:hypothetical protein PsYK624_150530 [Phanerochaete sordida]|uniref:Uncharacterized protein n=1 Tax=Phanerochaete sordida TaxID=48140 RepID=A0A9P3LKS1_9APHY|nr:hypothetical protein PsYK624_150530 [Phanerochaete sordida]